MQEVRAGVNTWAVAARDKWAMDAAKADRVPVLIAIDDADEVVGAWPVTGVSNESSVPAGKTRKVNRALSEVEEDRALDFLLGRSTWPRRRNPQTTVELRDVPGADVLISGDLQPQHGAVRLGDYKLAVSPTGIAEQHVPAGASVTVKTAN